MINDVNSGFFLLLNWENERKEGEKEETRNRWKERKQKKRKRETVKEWQKEERKGNVLFNDALNTFYLRLYGIRHMAKDHSDSEKGNPLPPHRLLFPINSNVHYPTDRIAHTMAFVTPVVEHWLE